MKCTTRYANGSCPVEHDSIQDAMTELLTRYPDGYAVDAGGFQVNELTDDSAYDIRSGRAAMVWADESSSENDDGAHSVAEIMVSGDE